MDDNLCGREIRLRIPKWMEGRIKQLIEEDEFRRERIERTGKEETIEERAWDLISFGLAMTAARGKKTIMNPICPPHWANSVSAVKGSVRWSIQKLRLASLGRTLEPEVHHKIANYVTMLARMIGWTLPEGYWPLPDEKDNPKVIEEEFGKVFVDLDEPDAWKKNLKVMLARAISRALQERGLSIASSASLFKISEEDVLDICYLQYKDLTVSHLIGFLNLLEADVGD